MDKLYDLNKVEWTMQKGENLCVIQSCWNDIFVTLTAYYVSWGIPNTKQAFWSLQRNYFYGEQEQLRRQNMSIIKLTPESSTFL